MPTLLRRCCLTMLAVSIAAIAVAADTRAVKVEDLTLTVPADWKQQPPSNNLRLAQFDIPPVGAGEPVEMVVNYFGGGGGGTDANIERWIGQFAADGRQVKITKGESPQGPYYFVDINGTYNMPVGPPIARQTRSLPGARMLAVILTVKNEGNYFLKMAGPAATVSPQADALRTSFGGNKAGEQPYQLK